MLILTDRDVFSKLTALSCGPRCHMVGGVVLTRSSPEARIIRFTSLPNERLS
jgi:hypothetical protein